MCAANSLVCAAPVSTLLMHFDSDLSPNLASIFSERLLALHTSPTRCDCALRCSSLGAAGIAAYVVASDACHRGIGSVACAWKTHACAALVDAVDPHVLKQCMAKSLSGETRQDERLHDGVYDRISL